MLIVRALVLAVVLVVALPSAASAQDEQMTIEEQKIVLATNEIFAVRVAVTADPDSRVRIEIHRNLGSRIELQQQLAAPAAEPGPVVLRQESLPIGQRRHVVVRVDGPDRPGVYPVSISLVSFSGEVRQRILTYVTRGPDSAADFPALDVALVLDARTPDGSDDALARRSAAQQPLELAQQLASRFPDLPLTVVLDPSDLPPDETTNAFAEPHDLVATTYVPVDLDAALRDGLVAELQRQVATASDAVRSWSAKVPAASLAVLDDRPTPELTSWLTGNGVSGLMIEPGRLSPLDPEAFPVTLLQPFLVEGLGEIRTIEADARLGQRVALLERMTDVQALVTELAVLQADRPALRRAVTVVVPLGVTERPESVEDFLGQLSAHPSVIRPVRLTVALSEIPLAVEGGERTGPPLVRSLNADETTVDLTGLGIALAEHRVILDDYAAFVGRNSPNLAGLERDRLDALDHRRDATGEQARIESITADLRSRFTGVAVPTEQQITLTAREAELPVTIRRLVDHDVTVQLRFDSEKLVFPNGEVLELTLTEPQTELTVPVVARTSGEFPVDLVVVSPSGDIVIAEGQLIVRSTAISGVGLVLGGGALLVLTVWWIRLIRRDRRERRESTESKPVPA